MSPFEPLRPIRIQRVKQHPVLYEDVYEIASIKQTTQLMGRLKNMVAHYVIDWLRNSNYIVPHFGTTEIDRFDYTTEKQKKLTDAIWAAAKQMQDYSGRFDPEKYTIVVGEDSFFEMLDEERAPFFSESTRLPLDPLAYSSSSSPYKRISSIPWSVYVIPATTGFAIIPKAIIEQKVSRYD